MDDVCTLHRGTAPLLISLPHDGIAIPGDLGNRLTPQALGVPDTDWFVSRLYGFARDLGASMLTPVFSRYVVDLNRPPDDVSLYPGQNTTGLCPTKRFDGGPVYLAGQEPGEDEVGERVRTYWHPYHAALDEELQRLRAHHGHVLLWEAHSIRSVLPFLFEGRLPDLNVGTAGGASCSPTLQARLESTLAAQTHYSWIANGRFKGGYITRHYGDPAQRIDAVQMELAQETYMDEATGHYEKPRAAKLQGLLESLLRAGLR